MSCHIIETKNVKKIVLSFRQHFATTQHTSRLRIPGDVEYSDITELDTMNRIGQMLVDENYRSYNTRYDETEPVEEFEITGQNLMYTDRFTAVEQLKALASYDAQACQTPDWEQTKAFKLIELMRYCAIAALPGYNDAEWI